MFLGEHAFSTHVSRDLTELFESGFKVFDDLLGKDIGIMEVVGLFEDFVTELEDVEAGFIAVVKQSKFWTYPLFSFVILKAMRSLRMISDPAPVD